MASKQYSFQELMAVSISRRLKDGQVAFMEGLSYIPMAACRIAQLSHAPNLTYIVGPSGVVNPMLDPLASSSGAYANLAAEAMLTYPQMILLTGRKKRFDVFFAGGLQVDKHGNCNMACLGDWAHPRLRGPGSLGLTFAGLAANVIIYSLGHTSQIFVEKVDFVSAPGFLPRSAGGTGRDQRSGSPSLVVTPLATMGFDAAGKQMSLLGLHPGATLEQVQTATGFDLLIPPGVPTIAPPSPKELELIRQIDPEHVLAGTP